MNQTATYQLWLRTKSACKSPTHPSYKNYGAKGVTFAPEWDDFVTFYKDMGEIPTGMNSLELIDPSKGFCKFNSRYCFRSRGRPKGIKKEREARDVFSDPKSITLTLEKQHFDFLKRQALHKSLIDSKQVTVNQLIREALESQYPMPKQLRLFS